LPLPCLRGDFGAKRAAVRWDDLKRAGIPHDHFKEIADARLFVAGKTRDFNPEERP
jgi:hypothetical protein